MATTCIISGTIKNLDDTPVDEVQVRATPVLTDDNESGQLAGAPPTVGVSSDSVVTFTDPTGAFSIALLKGTVVDLEIPEINLLKRITVPNSDGPIDFSTLI